MRSRLGIIFTAAILLASAAGCAVMRFPHQRQNLIWSEEFEGESLDNRKWNHHSPGVRRDGVNVPAAVALDGNGHLVISTRRVGGEWHTGMIDTKGKFNRKFGYFECRVRFQSQVGHWSAFWLRSPRMNDNAGSSKKTGAEIDIFEYLAKNPGQLRHAVHWNGYGRDIRSALHTHTQLNLNQDWHTVGLEWNSKEYIFYVDGRETWRTGLGISHVTQYMIISLEVGSWAGDIRRAELPDYVVFDYVRVFRRRPGS